MENDRKVGEPYNVQGYPTIKFFGKDKSKPVGYESGERTFDKFVDYCVNQVKDEVRARSASGNSDEL
jgi:protein disulfide-isomerase A6